KSGKNKDLGSPWQPMTPAERRIFKQLIDNYYERFLTIIRESREPKGMTGESLKRIADGRVFGPEQALEAKLIDGIKYPEAVYERAMELVESEDAQIVSYEYPYVWRGNIHAQSG